ncbi:putative xylanase/chitin deacetylase [Mycobacterium sp. JS623]|nr:putative xylanase/chitin deacetylase [Mycobacterium sp. JS623]
MRYIRNRGCRGMHAEGINSRQRTRPDAWTAVIFGALILILSGQLGGSFVAAASPPPGRSGATVVSLTFDDGYASQALAETIMATHHMNGTFYIPSGFVGVPGRMTLDQIKAIQDAGNEIGGHTVNHLHLPALQPAEQARQVCDDRVALSRDGLKITSFAYPFAALDAITKQIVARCGYNSARSEDGLFTADECSGSDCAFAETMPPADRYSVRTATPVIPPTRVAAIERQITDARMHGGGWVPIVFHEVCDRCSNLAISVKDFAVLLDWIQSESGNGVTVATVQQVVNGDVQNLVTGPVNPKRPDGQLINASLEVATSPTDTHQASAEDESECWQRAGYGTNSSTWARVESAHSGGWAEQVSIGSIASGDQKLVVQQDTGSCSPEVKQGQSYSLSAWYTSTAPVRFVVYYRDAQGRWVFWTQSPEMPPSAEWIQSSWQPPPIPADAKRLSFGLQIASTGTLTIDDYGMTLLPPPLPIWKFTGVALVLIVVFPTIGYVGWLRIKPLLKRNSSGSA